MTRQEAIDQIRRFLEHAPTDPGQCAGDLIGWITKEHDLFLCAHCAGRIFARGLRPPDSAPLWADHPDPGHLTCCGCNRVFWDPNAKGVP